MQPLATSDDLAARGIPTSNAELVAALLASTSAAIRDAAGTAISRQTSTVTLWTEPSRRIELPARPVIDVAEVLLDGEPVTDWKLRGSSLWRDGDWQTGQTPAELTVTFTHGFDPVPEDIVNLACMLAAAGLAAATDGFAGHRGIASVAVDDFRESYFDASSEVIDPTAIPEATRAWLRRRFASRSAVMGGAR